MRDERIGETFNAYIIHNNNCMIMYNVMTSAFSGANML